MTHQKSRLITVDGLHNVMTGLGSVHSKRSHNHYDPAFLQGNPIQLESAYTTDWLASAIVDYPAEDMTREWRTIKCEDADDIQLAEVDFGVRETFEEAVKWSRLYGGSAIVMITDQPLDRPLDLSSVKKGSLKRLLIIDRFMVSTPVMNYTDPTAPNFMLPQYYLLNGGSQRIHWTHVVRVNGRSLPYRLKLQTMGWGDSDLRKAIDDIMDFTASKAGLAELMAEANVDIITREGLTEDITTGEEADIIQRYALFNQMKSIVQMALLDSDEKYDRQTLNLSGVAPILDMFMTIVSGATGIPRTRLFGEQAKGLGNNGEGDLNNYYNNCKSMQASRINPALRQFDQVFVRSVLGYMPEDFNFQWNPLFQLNSKEIAEASKLEADTDFLYLQTGVVNKSQVMKKLQQQERYQYTEEQINEAEEAENISFE